MDAILPYLLNTVAGGAGGWLGNLLKNNNLGMLGNLLSGAVGGNVLPIALAALNLFGGGNQLVSILTAVLGGGLGSLVGGMLKK